MNGRTAIVMVLAGLAACHGHDDREAPAARAHVAKPALAHATQADLARELDDADRRGSWNDVRARWQGQLLHWTVTRQRLLCGSADACHVAPFPISRPAKYGWMPSVAFAAGEYAKLDAACGGADQCEVELEGTLAELVVSGELPTSLKLSDVQVVRATPERG